MSYSLEDRAKLKRKLRRIVRVDDDKLDQIIDTVVAEVAKPVRSAA